MSIFSKPKAPALDTGRLLEISKRTAEQQRKLIGDKFSGVQPINQQFETQRKQLSGQFEPGAEKLIGQYGQELGAVNQAEQAAGDAASAKFREQAFRDVPAIQQAIRNSLGGSRLMGSGAALSSLARPITQAAQSASDFAAEQEMGRLGNIAKRAEGLATTGFNTRQKAMADRLGIDEGTINELTQMGRTDLIDKFNSLTDVTGQEGANELGIEQLRQQNEMARAAASNKGAILSSLGSLGGLGLGALTGNPLGMAIGMQAGGTAGSLLGGEAPAQLDPTLLFALAQKNKGAVGTSLGSRGSYNPNANPYTPMAIRR